MLRSAALLLVSMAGLAAAEPTKVDALPAGALARFGSHRFAHFPQEDLYLAFSPDGTQFARAWDHGSILIQDAKTGEPIRELRTTGILHAIRWLPDGRIRAASSFRFDFMMLEWANPGDPGLSAERIGAMERESLNSGKEPRHGHRKHSFSDDASRIYAFTAESMDEYRFQAHQIFADLKPERSVAIEPDSGGVWCGNRNWIVPDYKRTDPLKVLLAYDFAAAKPFETPLWQCHLGEGPDRTPWNDVRSQDGKRVVIRFGKGVVEVWDGPRSKCLLELSVPSYKFHDYWESPGLALSSDRTKLAVVTRGVDGLMEGKIVDIATARVLAKLDPVSLPPLKSIAFSTDGRWLTRNSYGASFGFWNATTGADVSPQAGHCGEINSLAVAPDGSVAVTSGRDLTVRGWDPATARELWRVSYPQLVALRSISNRLAVVEESRTDLGVAEPVLDFATGKTHALPGGMGEEKPGRIPGQVTHDKLLAISPDGRRALTFEPQDRALRLWTWPAGKLVKAMPLKPPAEHAFLALLDARFSSDGSQVFVLADYANPNDPNTPNGEPHHPFLERWDLAGGAMVERSDFGKPQSLVGPAPVFVGNGTRLLVISQEGVRDCNTQKLLVAHEINDRNERFGIRPGVLALSADGKTLLQSGYWAKDAGTKFIDLKTGALRKLPYEDRLAAFLPDGRVITAGTTAVVWK